MSVMSRLPVAAPTVPAPAPMAPPINAPLPPPAKSADERTACGSAADHAGRALSLALGLTAELRGTDRVGPSVQMNAVQLEGECGTAFESAGGMSFGDGADSSSYPQE